MFAFARQGVGRRGQGQPHQKLVHGELSGGRRGRKRSILRQLQLPRLRHRHRAQGLWIHDAEQGLQLFARPGAPQRASPGETRATPRVAPRVLCSPSDQPVSSLKTNPFLLLCPTHSLT